MKRTLALSLLVTLLAVFLAALPVLAAPSLAVHIEAPTIIPTGPVPDRFEASGPAVDFGLISGTGDVYTFNLVAFGPTGGSVTMLRMIKHFVFDDGSGTFDVRLVVRLDFSTGITRGTWRVVGGTGAYANLQGTGRLIGIPIVLGQSILDIYDGRLR